jgi:MYXO-CTERM domain-containing protein
MGGGTLLRTRIWQLTTTVVAVTALMMTVGGPALAQAPDDLSAFLDGLDESEVEQVAAALEGDGGDLPEELQAVVDRIRAAAEDTDGDDGTGAGSGGAEDAGPVTGGGADVPEAGIGGFAGYAHASGTTVCVGLPDELREGLAPLLEGLGIGGACEEAGTDGIRIDLAQTQAELRRAAAGEEVSSEARALITNLVLGSPELDAPGGCQGGPMDVAIPDATTPLVTLSLLGVDCAETDERAFAAVEIAAVDIRLGNLIELGLPVELREGLQEAIDAFNAQLLSPFGEGLCEASDPVLAGLLGGGTLCEGGQSFLQLTNPLDVDVPLVDLELITATSEVVGDDGVLTATAAASLTGLNVLGTACLGGDGTAPYTFASTATTDGRTASRSASAPDLQLRACAQEQSLLRSLMSSDDPLGDIAIVERVVQEELVDGRFQAAFDGIDELLTALETRALTQGEAYTNPVEGAGTSAGTAPFAVVATLPLSVLGDTPLGDIGVAVIGNETAVGVNAAPAVVPAAEQVTTAAPEAEPSAPLPHTGGGLAGLLGLAALGAAATLRRRDRSSSR